MFGNSRATIRKQALRGDWDALHAYTQFLICRGNAKNEIIAANLLADAYHNIPSAAMTLANELFNGGDYFEADQDISMLWRQAAANGNSVAPAAAQNDAWGMPSVATPDTVAVTQTHSTSGRPEGNASPFRRIEASLVEDPMVQLEKLTGLKSVKEKLAEKVSLMKFEAMRAKSGLPVTDASAHFIFTGNPGTGKTTVARIIGTLFKNIGHLSSGHVIEVSVPELIGQFVGETPQKVQAALQASLGGVLFIDEAYGLVSSQQGGGDAYGEQAVTTLLKFMEDNRKNLTVIAAGYPEQMKRFLERNPGFKSRFTEIIPFEDYSAAELEHIYRFYTGKQHYKLSDDVGALLPGMMAEAPGLYDRDFPNARFVRNLFEDTVKAMATRVMKMAAPEKDDLLKIMAADLQQAFEEARHDAKFRSEGALPPDGAKYGYN